MGDEKKERRNFQRIFFSIEDGIKGKFIISSLQTELDLLTANVINLSKGGLALTISKDRGKKIKIGDHIILTEVKGIKNLEFLANVEVEVKWILDNPSLEFVGFGCEFNDIPESMREAIQTFIDSWSIEKTGERSEGKHI